MPTFRIETDQGTFDIEADREPTHEEALQAIGGQSTASEVGKTKGSILGDIGKESLEALPLYGSPSAFKEGYESGKELLGDNIAGKTLGALSGAGMVLGTAFNPITKGLGYVPKVVQAGSEAAGGQSGDALQTLEGSREVLPGVQPAQTTSVLKNLGSEFGTMARKDPLNTALMFLGVAKPKGLAKPFERGSVANQLALKSLMAADDLKNTVSDTVSSLKENASFGELGKTIKEGAKNVANKTDVGSRAVINIENMVENKRAIENLAQEAANNVENVNVRPKVYESVKRAASGDISPRHIEAFTSANAAERKIGRSIIQDSKAHQANRKAPDPALHVGEEFASRISQIEEIQNNIGKAQGEIVRNLPDDPSVLRTDPQMAAIARMNNVKGLRGLKLSEDGTLDFSNTELSSARSKAERAELQDYYNDIYGRSPKRLDNLRKEIFAVQGGKKGARVAMTDTLDLGLEAMRQGIADSIAEIAPEYKLRNEQYAKVTAPIQKLQKFFKGVEKDKPDILAERGANLGRRLTSNVQSAPELRAILNEIETQIKTNGGKVETNIANIQDMYNAAASYYDIGKDTGFAGQISLGISDIPISSKTDALIRMGKKVSGKTKAVQQKYLEDLVNSINE